MELLYPVHRIGDQEISYFVTAVIEYQGAPVEMLTFVRITVFITGFTGEPCQRKLITRKMRRYPVEYDTDAVLVCSIDQVT
jgi:hypothetical protein